MLVGAGIINPMYTGRSSRLVRKIVVILSGFYFYIAANNYKESWKYAYYVKFWDYYPPHVREYFRSKDSRHLLLFDVNNPPYKLYDETTKKALF